MDNLTREQIAALEPGRELDMLVARYLQVEHSVRRYSTNISAACWLVEFLRLYCMADYWVGYDNSELGYSGYSVVYRKKTDSMATVLSAKTMPLVICHSLIMAMSHA